MKIRLNKELHELVELINTTLLFLALILLIFLLLGKEKVEIFLYYLDIVLTFFLVVELTIKYFRSESDKEFFKKNWLVILALVPLVLFIRIFYFLGIIKEEKEAEKLNLLIHEADKFLKEKEILKTKPVYKFLYFLIKKPIVPRAIQKVFGLLILSLEWFEDNRKNKKKKKSAFSLDLETLVKVILLIALVVIFALILLSLKNSKFIEYLKWM